MESGGTELGDCFSHLLRHKETTAPRGREGGGTGMECTLQLGDAAVPSPLPGATLIKLRRLLIPTQEDKMLPQCGKVSACITSCSCVPMSLQQRTTGIAADLWPRGERNFGAELPERRLENGKWTELSRVQCCAGLPDTTAAGRKAPLGLSFPHPFYASLGRINKNEHIDSFFPCPETPSHVARVKSLRKYWSNQRCIQVEGCTRENDGVHQEGAGRRVSSLRRL